MTPSPAQVFFNEAVEWESQFTSSLEANDRIAAWEACEYARMYADLTQAAAVLQQQKTLENIACEIAAGYDLQSRLAEYASR